MLKYNRLSRHTKFLILLLLVFVLVPSGGIIVQKTETRDLYAQNNLQQSPQPTTTAAVLNETAAVVVPVVTPLATPAPTPKVFSLPVNDFSIGSIPKADCYTADGYSDESITVKLWKEAIDGSVYNCCEVQIADGSQFRTALGGTVDNPSSVRFSKLSSRNYPVVAINGDYYNNRIGSYAVRQSQLLQDTNTSPLDMMIVDYEGNFHLYTVDEKVQAVEEMTSQMYQVFSFGPILVRDSVMFITPDDYIFDPDRANPRAAIGQLGPLHYLLVVVDGRTDYSKGITSTEMAAFMKSKNCIHAYGLDGGASASIYFDGRIFNHGTDSGERSMYDIIYFASAAE